MRRWQVFVVLIALAGLAGVATFLWAVPARPEVSLTTVARLTPGVSESDVAGFFGLPVADVTNHPRLSLPRLPEDASWKPPVAVRRLP